MSNQQQAMLPKGWTLTILGDVFQWSSGGTPSTGNSTFYDGDIPWVVSGDLQDEIILSVSRTITNEGLKSSAAKWVIPGSVLVALYGATIGKLGIAGIPLTTNQAIASTYPYHINGRYLLYYLFGQRHNLVESGKGAAQRNISQQILKAYPFPIAPLPEQDRIVEEIEKQFSRLDAGVENLKRVQANLKRYRVSVLKAACEGRLVPTEAELAEEDGRDYESATELLKRILIERRCKWEENELAKMRAKGVEPTDDKWKARYKEPSAPDISGLPDLPKGWCWANVRQIGTVQLGRQRAPLYHSGPNMKPYLRVANVFEDRLDLSDVKFMNFDPYDFETYKLKSGDILLNEGQSLELVGRAAMYKGEVPNACFQNTLIRFQANEFVFGNYALIIFRSYLHSGRFQRIASWTTSMAHLGAERFAGVEMPLPPLREQYRIAIEIERQLSIIAQMDKTVKINLKRAQRLRQSILKRAFEGKLVQQDSNDEPAEVLLEKIRAERTQRKQHQGKQVQRKNQEASIG